MNREPWRAAVHGVAKSRSWLSDWTELKACHSFYSKEPSVFSLMAAITVCSDFGAQENKVYSLKKYQLVIRMSSLEKCLFSYLPHFLIGLFIFLELSCISCLYIFEPVCETAKRHRCVEWTFGLWGRGRGWYDLGEWHWNLYTIM